MENPIRRSRILCVAMLAIAVLARGSTAASSQTADSHPEASGPLHVAAGVMQAISHPIPIYPPNLIALHTEGAVVLGIVISPQGEVTRITSVSGGPESLFQSARDAVQQWKFTPYLLNGQPTEVETTVAVYYNLGQSSDQNSPANPTTTVSTQIVPKQLGDAAVSPPIVTYAPKPKYPDKAIEEAVEGSVVVNLLVDERGKPLYVHVLRGVGKGLDEEAIAALKQYKFTPATENGKPVPVFVNIKINFVLE